MRNNSLIVLEIIWLITGLLCIFVSIKLSISGTFNKVPLFAIMAVISFVFAYIRHNQRKKS
jgi:hypothetical protein